MHIWSGKSEDVISVDLQVIWISGMKITTYSLLKHIYCTYYIQSLARYRVYRHDDSSVVPSVAGCSDLLPDLLEIVAEILQGGNA